MNAVYRLKPMVAARLLAEVSALILLATVPVFLFFHGDFERLSAVSRILSIALSLVSLVVLPAYGFVTYEAACTDDGLQTRSLFKKQQAPWSEIKTVQLKTSWGWRRYVVKAASGELNFPVWLSNVQQLCETIRARLPNRGSVSSAVGATGTGARTFKLAPTAAIVQGLQVAANVAFVVLFWVFFSNITSPAHAKPPDKTDQLVILIACCIFTLVMVLRSAFYVLSPRVVTTDKDGLLLRTWFFQKKYAWSDLKSLLPSLFFMPEGLMIKTTGMPVFMADQLDSFDELMEELARKLPPPKTVA